MTESSSPTKLVNFLILETFQIKDFEGHKYEEVDYFSWQCALGPQSYYFLEINYTHENKFSIILKYLQFEVVTYEIPNFEGHKYEEIDQFS